MPYRHPDKERFEDAARKQQAAEETEKRLRIAERRQRIGRVVRIAILTVIFLAAVVALFASLFDVSDARYRQWGRGG